MNEEFLIKVAQRVHEKLAAAEVTGEIQPGLLRRALSATGRGISTGAGYLGAGLKGVGKGALFAADMATRPVRFAYNHPVITALGIMGAGAAGLGAAGYHDYHKTNRDVAAAASSGLSPDATTSALTREENTLLRDSLMKRPGNALLYGVGAAVDPLVDKTGLGKRFGYQRSPEMLSNAISGISDYVSSIPERIGQAAGTVTGGAAEGVNRISPDVLNKAKDIVSGAESAASKIQNIPNVMYENFRQIPNRTVGDLHNVASVAANLIKTLGF